MNSALEGANITIGRNAHNGLPPYAFFRQPIEWRWSSVHRYIRLGLLAPDWATALGDGEFGQ